MLWYEPDSKEVMLMPVPEYPVITDKLNEDASEFQPNNSMYNEDGSLQVLKLKLTYDLALLLFLRFLSFP